MMEEYDIGSQHIIWINPFCLDVMAEVVSYDSDGNPIMRTMDEEELTLEPHEYVFPTAEERRGLETVARYFKEVYGEEL